MKLTVIGHWGAYPAAREATSGYLLQTDELNVLLDCGSGVLSHVQTYLPLEKLDAVILSHYHTDHMADIYSLQYATMILTLLGKREKPLTIYAREDHQVFETLHYETYCQAQAISTETLLQLGDIQFSFFENVHPAPCLSIRAERGDRVLAYTADSEWTDELLKTANGADVLLCEASLYDKQRGTIKGHLTGKQAGELAARAGAKNLILTHLPHYGDHQELLAEAQEVFRGSIELAALGKTVEI
jgi:ribonuclease BN (tRNA processing enzyme)